MNELISPQTPLSCPLCCGHDTAFFFADKKNYCHIYHRCRRCDLVFVHPDCRLDSAAEKSRYDMHINDYSEPYVRFLSRLASPMLSRLSPAQVGLDFGSGVSQAMADLFRQAGHRCDCYDVYFYPDSDLLSRQYDFVVASEVIEHLYEPKAVFERWLSLLKLGGMLGVMTGMRPTDDAFPDWWYKNDPTHVALFSLESFDYLWRRYRLRYVFQAGNVVIFKK